MPQETVRVIPATTGILTVSKISYRTDLRWAAGRVIPLGAIAEICVGPLRALGLIARSKLVTEEIELVGGLLKPQIAFPFGLLKSEFEWAWAEVASGESLTALAARNAQSLMFSSPTETRPHTRIELTSESLIAWATGELWRERNAAFLDLLEETKPKAPRVEREDHFKIAA